MSFADFPAQHRVVELLQRSLERGRLGHAYLFTGGTLSELEAVARTLAKTLNCLEPVRGGGGGGPAVDCCDRCLSCRKIQEGIHPDIQWIRPESKMRIIKIDQMRDLMQTIYLKPSEARFKMAVIVAADRLKEEAANAFLKTLEEPPKETIFILLSSDHQRILETILSRCLRLHFAGEAGPAAEPAYREWLEGFSKAAAVEKSLLGRYRLLGSLLGRLAKMKETIGEDLGAKSPVNKYDDAEANLRDKWEDELNAAIEAEYRKQRADFLLTLQWWLRDVWLHTLSPGTELCSFPNFTAESQTIAKRISTRDALQNLVAMERTQSLLHTNVQEALALEVGFLNLKLG